ncbi:hypothetical protein TCAL_10067 [Tigriopus californicus]|uniref:Plant heme peroxidase family profile domain-containing protein n=1 Tax=Tigriopus californicus TaxID=6832 RepID=A0A553N8L0_TIGCA|nr:putative ascorbate peroxidase [Tigriopus californicus]TRY61750.1 hypothetical protein TCAL_10067 [Tigriopus californicus]
MTSLIYLTFITFANLCLISAETPETLSSKFNQLTPKNSTGLPLVPVNPIDALLDQKAAITDVEQQEKELDELVAESQLDSPIPIPVVNYLEPYTIHSFTIPQNGHPPLTKSRLSFIQSQLREIIFEDRIAHVVRIIFHDCVGGCDGCLNRDLPPNMTPMLNTATLLDNLYDSQGFSDWLSRADFYALAGITAIEIGVENANVGCFFFNCIRMPRFHFRYGRKDCATSPLSSGVQSFPEGKDDYDAVMEFFANEFGLRPRYATALLGAHTLGGAAGAAGSGFVGFWKENAIEAAKFDQRYFSLLSDRRLYWNHLDVSAQTGANSPRFQWEGFVNNQQVSFMLNSDVSLLLDIQTNNVGQSSCNFNTCPYSPTALLVHIYARFPNFWIRDFERAFARMIENGSTWLLAV